MIFYINDVSVMSIRSSIIKLESFPPPFSWIIFVDYKNFQKSKQATKHSQMPQSHAFKEMY